MAGRSENGLNSQLKSTCDACNSAKIKCSQARPRCGRCESRGLYCHYSVSLRSAKRRHQNSFHDNASSGKSHSPEAYDNVTMPTPAVSSELQVAELSSFDLHSFEDTDFVSPLLESWNRESSMSGSQVPYSDDGGESIMDLSQFINPKNRASCQNPAPRSPWPRKTANNPVNGNDISSIKSAGASSNACSCQSDILDKLSELSASRRDGSPVPFDKSLSENRNIIALSSSMINCPNKQHDQDIILVLTGVALITQLISVYGQPPSIHSHDSNGDVGTVDTAVGEVSSPGLSTGGSLTSSREMGQHQHHTQRFSRVRLSLGSYQLDQKDEQILQTNLLKIELSKIGVLIDSFEKRFCVLDYGWVTGARTEPQPLGEIITYLKKRLRATYEALVMKS